MRAWFSGSLGGIRRNKKKGGFENSLIHQNTGVFLRVTKGEKDKVRGVGRRKEDAFRQDNTKSKSAGVTRKSTLGFKIVDEEGGGN